MTGSRSKLRFSLFGKSRHPGVYTASDKLLELSQTNDNRGHRDPPSVGIRFNMFLWIQQNIY